MIVNLGLGALALALLVCAYAVGAALWGVYRRDSAWVASARNAGLAVFPLTLLSAAAIVYAIVSGDYSVEFVYSVSSRATPLFLKLTALWGGQNGSILFWALLLSGYIFALMWTARGDRMLLPGGQAAPLLPWVIVVTMITQGFFLALVLFLANPFARWWALPSGDIVSSVLQPIGAAVFTPMDGRGLNPLLRHPGMVIHPPMLYMGFTGFTIPFAFAIAALVTGRTDAVWIRQTRRWTLVAYLFLSLGLALGGRWAYDVLGWGGYWGWDAVENSSLLPWLTATAFVHSVMIQEKRGMFKAWNMLLIILTYALVILGTFITRTGIISSVHAFARSKIGPPFLIFVALTLLAAAGLMSWRWTRLRSENRLNAWLSREAVFLAQNVLFLLITFTVAWGTYFPMISEQFADNKLTVGPAWFNAWVGPQLFVLLLLMGVAPLTAWGYSVARSLGRLLWLPTLIAVASVVLAVLLGAPANPFALLGYLALAFTGFVTLFEYGRGALARARSTGQPAPVAAWTLLGRNRRRYGGYLVHLGIVLIGLGVLSSTMFQQTTQGQLARGESLGVAGYSITYRGLQFVAGGDDQKIALATVDVYQGGTYLGALQPQVEQYLETGETMTPPAVYPARLGLEDVYVILVGWETIGDSAATFKVYINPLVNLIWGGGLLFVFGLLAAMWPDGREVPTWTVAAVPVRT